MFYIQTNEVLVEASGWKDYITGIAGVHEIRVYVKGNFESFIISATWGEQCKYFENCFIYFVFMNERLYFKSLEGYR